MTSAPTLATVLGVLALSPVLAAGLTPQGDAQLGPGPTLGERYVVLIMERTHFNLQTWPDTPLIEAYVGEALHFTVYVPPTAEPHTFHIHGHPWFDPDVGRFIDTKLLFPRDVTVPANGRDLHQFTIIAGTEDGNAGDWLYHCHMDDHFARGMFGILRVYPYSVDLTDDGDTFEVRVHRTGEPLDGVTLAVSVDGTPIEITTVPTGPGSYELHPARALPAAGELVVRAEHALGESVARADLDAGGLQLVRDVLPPPGYAELTGLSDRVRLPGTPSVPVPSDGVTAPAGRGTVLDARP